MFSGTRLLMRASPAGRANCRSLVQSWPYRLILLDVCNDLHIKQLLAVFAKRSSSGADFAIARISAEKLLKLSRKYDFKLNYARGMHKILRFLFALFTTIWR